MAAMVKIPAQADKHEKVGPQGQSGRSPVQMDGSVPKAIGYCQIFSSNYYL
jgi:hypothetical protein